MMKKKYKIIQHFETKIICDNNNCDFETEDNILDEDIVDFINKKCPDCGDVLLTEKDYKYEKSLEIVIKWINIICFPYSFLKGGFDGENRGLISYRHHDGIVKIKEE